MKKTDLDHVTAILVQGFGFYRGVWNSYFRQGAEVVISPTNGIAYYPYQSTSWHRKFYDLEKFRTFLLGGCHMERHYE
jgi:hypothetical protein